MTDEMKYRPRLRELAEGGAFDVTEAIRLLALALLGTQHHTQTEELPRPGDSRPAANTSRPANPIAILLDERLASILAQAGYGTAQEIRQATDEELLAIKGIAVKTVALIRRKLPG